MLLAIAACAAGAQAQEAPAAIPPATSAPAAVAPTAETPPAGTAPGAAQTPQPAAAPAADLPPPPPSYSAEPAVPYDRDACFPACRSGYLCHEQQCISACNPACAQGQECSATGECIGAAAPPSAASGARRHDGFMLRLSLGIGGGMVREHVSGGTVNALGDDARTVKYTGVTLGPTLDLGGSLSENLVLHGRLALLALPSPALSEDGDDAGRAKDLTVNGTTFGPAISYYFMPLNVFVTAAIALGSLRFDYDENSDRDNRASGTGLGLQLDGGKEWWVGDSWALGAALRLEYSSIARHDDNAGWTREYSLIGAAAMFSATYQ